MVKVDPAAVSPLDQMIYSADSLAKSFYSAISADLGMADKPNVLTDEKTLQNFTQNYGKVPFVLISAGPANNNYNALKAVTGKPQINSSSTIFTTYLCQTPKRKLTTALLVSVVLANLVLLRALWSVMTIVAVYYVNARDPKGESALSNARNKSADP